MFQTVQLLTSGESGLCAARLYELMTSILG